MTTTLLKWELMLTGNGIYVHTTPSADATLIGIELHHMLRKKQHTESDNQTIFEQFHGLAA